MDCQFIYFLCCCIRCSGCIVFCDIINDYSDESEETSIDWLIDGGRLQVTITLCSVGFYLPCVSCGSLWVSSAKYGKWERMSWSGCMCECIDPPLLPSCFTSEDEAPRFSRQLADRWQWSCQPYVPAVLYPQEDSWYVLC
jgi:hypothetical protein